jgi:hypothetical protein
MTDELDSIILKPARWQLDDYLKAKKAIQALIAKECTKARIDELNTIDDGLYDVGASKGEWGIPTKWSKDNYADLWTPNNAIHEYIQGCIAELSNKDSK